ncbi:MAG: hypothetical protein ABR535_09830, partial [Pyrinomonadaceae bacterium]
SYTYQNHKVIGQGGYQWIYDADGRNLHSSFPDPYTDSTYDAAGRFVKFKDSAAQVETERFFDGTGQEAKSVARNLQPPSEVFTNYFIRSSVLNGEIVSVANSSGKKLKTYVRAAGATLARQNVGYDTSGNPVQTLEFEQWDASQMSYRQTLPNAIGSYDGTARSGEADAVGNAVGLNGIDYVQASLPPERDYPLGQARHQSDSVMYRNGTFVRCVEDGMETSCARQQRNLGNGVSGQCPNGDCGPISSSFRGRQVLTMPFTAYSDGHSGYIPAGGRYRGNGTWSWGPGGAPKPTLRGASRLSPAELARRRALAATGVFDNEGDGSDDWRSPFHFFSSDRKLSDEDCDAKMSRIFGGTAKAMEGAKDITGTNRALYPGHSATPANNKPVWREQEMGGPKVKDLQRGGIIHNYTDATGSPRTDVPLTAPGGWVAGYSDFLGGNPITGLRYSNGITIEFVHVGTTNRNQIPFVPAPGDVGSLRIIGYVGGAGSTAPTSKTYHHSHIVFYSNKSTYTTIDPRKLFCGW